MRKCKRIPLLAAAMATALMCTPAVDALAVNITVDGNAKEYQAYKLLDLTTSLKAGDSCETEGKEHGADCWNYSYTVNSKYGELLKGSAVGADTDGDGAVSDRELIEWIGKLDADQVRTFADSVWGGITTKGLGADFTSNGKIITVDSQGYYLITESVQADDPDSVSLVMLDTAGSEDIRVTSKEDIPTLEKKVKIDGTWQDAVDAARGETVTFRLTGGLPKNIGNYETYKYIFHDTMSAGLTFKAVESVTINGTVVDASKYTVVTESSALTDGCTLEVKFDDLVAVADGMGITLAKDSSVVVTYTADVNADATVGNTGNPNDAHLEFSNNPYVDGDTSTTPDDTVKVFQFDVVINKVDKNGQPLTGADFTLYKNTAAEGADASWEEVTTLSKNENGTVFTFGGLAQGSYRLVETTVPNGYNKADDVYFNIEAVYDTEADDPLITSFVIKQDGKVVSEGEDAMFQISANLGTATGSVTNTSGIQLPHTGEIGRAVLLYGGIGAIVVSLVAVAVAGRKKNERRPD